MNTKTSVFVALLAIATMTTFIEGAPGDLGEPCLGWCCFVGSFPIPKTHCSDKACPFGPCFLKSSCNAGLNCCKGDAPATTTTTTTSTTTDSTTTTETTPTTEAST